MYLFSDEQVAAACHALICSLQYTAGDPAPAAWCWATVPDDEKEIVVKSVELIRHQPDTSYSQLHAFWCDNKRASGWVYGEEKDASATPPTHPNIRDWADLPRTERIKDILFKTTVITMTVEA